jgi:hypothetical protein
MGQSEGGDAVAGYLNAVMPIRRREDAQRLDEIFREVTGWTPRLWSGTMVGYGRYDYRYDSGRTGSSLATGFAARKANMVLYIMPGYADFGDILGAIGPHKRGKSCFYFQRLKALDETALRALIKAGLEDLAHRWPVYPV